MKPTTWPSVALASVLLLCTTMLVWRGLISAHVFSVMGGAILSNLVTKNANVFNRKLKAEDLFTPEEIPTKKDLADVARTAAMPAKRREDL